jgi:GT2 family glycosyltransferase
MNTGADPCSPSDFQIDSPRRHFCVTGGPCRLSGSLNGTSGAPAPGVRVRLGRRILHCPVSLLTPAQPAGGQPRYRFEISLFTRGGLKLLRFQTESRPGRWKTVARRLVYVRPSPQAISYRSWIEECRNLYPPLPPPDSGPLISVFVSMDDPSSRWLPAMIAGVRRQTYTRWELCLTGPNPPRSLSAAAAHDTRIKWLLPRDALARASGDYVAFLGQNDLLAPEALSELVRAINLHPHARILYSDEDKIDALGRRFGPHFKSAWNPDLLLGQNTFCHLTAYHTALLRRLGGLRLGFEGAQDWDLALRAVGEVPADSIIHIPRILYHWRAVKDSPALARQGEDPPHLDSARRILEDHLARTGIRGEVLPVAGGHWRIRRTLPDPAPKVTLIIPTRNRLDLLRPCVESILARTRYPDFEVLVVDNGSDQPETLDYLRGLADSGRAQILRDDGPFNYSALNNRAARVARGSLLALVNNDIEPVSPGWLEEMVTLAVRPSTGAVGALLHYPDDSIQHAGVILGLTGHPSQPGVAGHAFLKHTGDVGYMNRLRLVQNYTAVTAACLVLRREVFFQVGGLDEHNLAVAFNDVDLCLRLREAGYLNTWTPFARLYHHESASRGADNTPEKNRRYHAELAYMRHRWGPVLDNDPAHNPNLSLLHHDCRWSTSPRPPADARTHALPRP